MNVEIVKIGDSNLKIADGNYSAKYPRSEEFIERGIPFIRGNNFKNKSITDKDMYFISPEKHSELKKGHVKPRDVLITTRGNIGKVALVPDRHDDSNINAQIVLLRCNEGWHPEYLLHTFNSDFVTRQIPGLTTGSALKQLPVKNLKKLKIPLPPLPQQKKIAAILDAADSYRQKTKALIAKYEELTQSLFLDMFGDPVTNPKGWDEVIFTDVLILRRGFDLPVQDRTKGEYPIMASNGILDWHNDFKVQGPGVVTGRSGTLGHVHLVEADYWPLNTALYSQDLNGNNPTFLLFLVRNFRVERFSRGAGVPTLNRNLVHAESIMKIPIDLQNQFAERVEAIEKQKAQAEASLVQAEDLFNSLLQRAFKGELS